jgi:beta-lactam-binding protein with PASTA domain
VPGGSQVLLYFGEEPERASVAVPDFTGMNRQQAVDAAGAIGLYILVTGNDEISPRVTVTGQDIPAGTLVAVGTTIKLNFADTKAAD